MIKQISFIALTIIVCATATAAQTTNVGIKKQNSQARTSSRVVEQLTNLELHWHRALERTDTEMLDQLLAREWFITNGSGLIISKAELMRGLRAGEIRFISTVPTEITVHAYGNAAVVTKRSTDKTMYGSSPGGGTYQMTDMFVKINGYWYCVATHATKDLKS